MVLNELLKLISDENRSRILIILRQGEICVCDLAEKLDIEQSLLSHHLKKLKSSDLIIERKVGRWVHYSLNKIAFETLGRTFNDVFGSEGILYKKCDVHAECCTNDKCKI